MGLVKTLVAMSSVVGIPPACSVTKKGKTESEKNEIFNDSILLEGVGISALVLESVEEKLASKITNSLKIPTIGIGSGNNCDGEIRVIDDIIGSYPWFTPPFASPFCSVSDNIREAVKTFQKIISKILPKNQRFS